MNLRTVFRVSHADRDLGNEVWRGRGSSDFLAQHHRLYHRATLAEKEVTSLKEKLATQSGSSGAAAMAPPPPDQEDSLISSQHELAAKDKEISSLIENVQRLQSSLNQMRESSATKIRLLEDQLEQKQDLISRLEARLDSQRDYDELKRELMLMKGSPLNDPSINGVDSKDTKDNNKRPSSPMMPARFLLGPAAAALPVEAFGSILGDEIVHQWRRSLERSLLASSPPGLHHQTQQHGGGHHHHMNNAESPSPPPPQDESPHDSESNMNMDRESMLNGSVGGGNGEGRLPFRYEDSLIPKSDPMEAKLQEMLRHSMDKFGSQCLDTLQIARRVRELLSIHNIGQRLFAKYVLGLSQGTVSELLSKPKPWDKLTEKGRDSYRKMHAWAADDASVLLLKSLIPKKGKDGNNLPASFRCEDSGAEDRIAHILSEANQALQQRSHNMNNSGTQDSFCDESGGSKSPLSVNNNGCNNNGQCPSPLSTSSARDRERERRMRKYENDDIPQEQVARIYQEELAKLAGIRLPHSLDDPRIPREHYQSLLFPHLFGGSLLEREDIRMALDAYHRELAKLAASSTSGSSPQFPPPHFHPGAPLPNINGLSGAQDLTMPKRLSPFDTKDKDDKSDKDDGSDIMRHVGSAFSLVRPKGERGDLSVGESNSGAPSPLNSILPPSNADDSSNASPLQRMASITNSLISQPTAPSVASPNQRPLKAVLPPITQQQFDQYNNLNTEDIVRKVKEQLSQYSISQRLFGESVLGLSQGSVSDLLARPKPWHMLTQKGREPFIRMKMFLEDENAVHKLVASQYKIAPEKLMRTGGYAGNPTPLTSAKVPAKPAELSIKVETSSLPPPPPPMPSTPQQIVPNMVHDFIKKSNSSSPGNSIPNSASHHRPPPPGLQPQPSVYEMAALTQDLDTQLITTKIKEALLANNIGQKIFGEAVLGLSQGSVSELLSKPKPWHMLSIKGREPFIRMQLWLADPLNVERLQHLKNERREANKRKRGLPHSNSPMDAYGSGTQGSSDNSNDSPNDSYSPGSSNAAAPPNKKQRVLFSEEQKEALKLAFALDPYPNIAAIEFLARELALSSRTITNWFHNHRMRLKQQTSSPLVQEASQPFDPVQFRLLLHQRLLELHKDKFPMFSFMGQQSDQSIEEGLDLTVSNTASRVHSDDDFFEEEDEDDDNEGSVASEDSCASNSSRTLHRKRKSLSLSMNSLPEKSMSAGGKHGVAPGSGSSRRKPVAPQWFNPSWHDDSDDEEVINGVCVFQNAINYSGNKERPEPNSPSEAVKPKYVDSREGSIVGGKSDEEESHEPQEAKVKAEKESTPEQKDIIPGAHAATVAAVAAADDDEEEEDGDKEEKREQVQLKEEVESDDENGD
ncbi:homeobox protein cut isoform X3 [Folsomia candida]|uniref:homeobox protein cut isoform X3 n=1 Tax=Folsomia candida TaxID=158441 RepID=UPI0016052D9B|nr:homeobox protein cut isoform X3 [Folsomia candida]